MKSISHPRSILQPDRLEMTHSFDDDSITDRVEHSLYCLFSECSLQFCMRLRINICESSLQSEYLRAIWFWIRSQNVIHPPNFWSAWILDENSNEHLSHPFPAILVTYSCALDPLKISELDRHVARVLILLIAIIHRFSIVCMSSTRLVDFVWRTTVYAVHRTSGDQRGRDLWITNCDMVSIASHATLMSRRFVVELINSKRSAFLIGKTSRIVNVDR
jgi:hypothetical protein